MKYGKELNQDNKKLILGSLAAITANILYGFSFLFTKSITETVEPFYLLAWRFTLAFIVIKISTMTKVLKVDFKGKSKLPLIRLAFIFPIAYFLTETLGIQRTTATESSSLIACIPVISLLASTIILKEKPSKFQTLGVLVTLSGVLVAVLGKHLTASLDIPGYLLVMFAVLSFAVYSVFTEAETNYTSTEKTYVFLGMSAIFFMLIAIVHAVRTGEFTHFITLPFKNTEFLIAISYLGIACSFICFNLDNYGLVTIGVNKFSAFIGLSTLTSILSGVIILHEPFSTLQIIGAVLIIAGVYIASFIKNKA